MFGNSVNTRVLKAVFNFEQLSAVVTVGIDSNRVIEQLELFLLKMDPCQSQPK